MMRALPITALLVSAVGGAVAQAQPGPPTVRVSTPATVLFQVTDVGSSTVSAATTVSFQRAQLDHNEALQISVKADGNLVMAGGSTIAASGVSWTTSNLGNGTGLNGSLSTAAYTVVFVGRAGGKAGQVDLMWRLSAPGSAVRAGTYQATLRWKFEVITP